MCSMQYLRFVWTLWECDLSKGAAKLGLEPRYPEPLSVPPYWLGICQGTYTCDPKSFHVAPKRGSGHGCLHRRWCRCVERVTKHLLKSQWVKASVRRQPTFPWLSPPQPVDTRQWHRPKQWWALGDNWPPLFILAKGGSLGHHHSQAPPLLQLFLMPSREIFSFHNTITATIICYLYAPNLEERKVNQPQSLPSGSLNSSRRNKPWRIAILQGIKCSRPQERDGAKTTRIQMMGAPWIVWQAE